jgi:hypothetical protein
LYCLDARPKSDEFPIARHIYTYFGEHIMLNSLKTWAGEVTTGHGVMVLSGTLLGILSGQIPWSGAAPLMAAGVIGLIWPENAALQAAGQTVATEAAGLVTAYNNEGTTPPSRSTRI